MKRITLLTIVLIIISSKMFAQNSYQIILITNGTDTFPCVVVPTYTYAEKRNKREEARFTRLIYNIRKVYPYARLSAVKLKEYDDMLTQISDVNEQKRLMKEAEKEIRKQFQKEIENLTFSQGVILLKLVDRETGKTTYKIVDELRGSLRAFFYQSIARLFGMNLKNKYNPNSSGTDKEIEQIVRMIECGEL